MEMTSVYKNITVNTLVTKVLLLPLVPKGGGGVLGTQP